MKKHLILTYLWIMGAVLQAGAQPFSAIRTDRVYYYRETLPPGYVYGYMCVFTDTLQTSGTDTVYSLRKIPSGFFTTNKCVPMEPTFMGSKIVKTQGAMLFFNRRGDTLHLNTNMQPGWSLFHTNDSLKIKVFSAYAGKVTDTVMNEPESLHAFRFLVVNYKGDSLRNHLISQQQIYFSENWELANSLPWLNFPYYNTLVAHYKLTGVLHKDGSFRKGIVNKYVEHTFDYAAGDEIHTHYSDCGWIVQGVSSFCNDEFVRTKILSRTIAGTMVHYSDSVYTENYQRTFYLNDPSKNTEIKKVSSEINGLSVDYDPVKFPYTLQALYPYLPGNGAENFRESGRCGKMEFNDPNYIRHGSTYYYVNDTCWGWRPEPSEMVQQWYIDGIGGPFYSYSIGGGLGTIRRELVYYQSGSCKGGTPIGLMPAKPAGSLYVFPNPVATHFTLELDGINEPLSLELYTLTGTLLLSKTFFNGTQTDVSSLPEGIYLLRVKDSGEERVYYSRMVISR